MRTGVAIHISSLSDNSPFTSCKKCKIWASTKIKICFVVKCFNTNIFKYEKLAKDVIIFDLLFKQSEVWTIENKMNVESANLMMCLNIKIFIIESLTSFKLMIKNVTKCSYI